MDEEDFFMIDLHGQAIAEATERGFENWLHMGELHEIGCDERDKLGEDIRGIDCLFDLRDNTARIARALERIADKLEGRDGGP